MRNVLFVIVAVSITATAHSETIYLKDGSKIIGTIIKADDETMELKTPHGILKINREMITSIDYAGQPVEERKQTPSPPTGPAKIRLLRVEVIGGAAQVLTDGAARFNSFFMEAPARLVIDLNDTVLTKSASGGEGNGEPVVSWRVGQLRMKPRAVARVVFVLRQKLPYEVWAEEGGLQVQFEQPRPVETEWLEELPSVAESVQTMTQEELNAFFDGLEERTPIQLFFKDGSYRLGTFEEYVSSRGRGEIWFKPQGGGFFSGTGYRISRIKSARLLKKQPSTRTKISDERQMPVAPYTYKKGSFELSGGLRTANDEAEAGFWGEVAYMRYLSRVVSMGVAVGYSKSDNKVNLLSEGDIGILPILGRLRFETPGGGFFISGSAGMYMFSHELSSRFKNILSALSLEITEDIQTTFSGAISGGLIFGSESTNFSFGITKHFVNPEVEGKLTDLLTGVSAVVKAPVDLAPLVLQATLHMRF